MLIPDNTTANDGAAVSSSITETTCCIDDPAQYYDTILQKTLLQCNTPQDTKENKQIYKKYMKQSVALASSYLSRFLGVDTSIVDVEMVLPVKDVMESDGCLAACFLDAGCQYIVLEADSQSGSSSSLQDVMMACQVCGVPRERMVIHFGSLGVFTECFEDKRGEMGDKFGVVSVGMDADLNLMKKVAEEIVKDKAFKFVIQIPSSDDVCSTVGEFAKSVKEDQGHVSLIDPSAQQLGSSYASCLKTDRADGLYTTVVCTRSNEALGLVYSSKESIVAALQSARGVYYSRSRNSLWRKGDTSGHHQTLHRIDVDCDGDALRFTVTQNGDETKAFCHLNTLTCWGEPRGLRHLEGVLQKRLVDAPAGSYTKRLFEDEELLRDKLVEEAQELNEADTKQHVAEELADVIYFAMVRAAKAGVSIDDAVVELDKRARKVTRRQGDSKAYRIQAGNEILGKGKDGK
jgi:phosphoribosyl-ATP pyrophosphohydrolase/phosphoribosyl-AMP cyclohydrolase/histidinol dehydrogenase